MNRYDLIVIGAGPGGYELAAEAARLGHSTAIIERDHLGGTCLNRGCIPTKALLRSASVADTLRDAARYGINATAQVDYATAAARKDAVVSTLRQAVEDVLSGVTIINGEARFTGPHTVVAGQEEYTAPRIVIATGSRPAMPPINGIENALNSDDLLAATSLPASITIIGGGVIGMEFAQILNAFGTRVTVVEYCPEILPPFDREIAKKLRQSLSRQGIEIIVDAQVTAITPSTVTFTRKGKEKTIESYAVLAATGRVPVIPDGATDIGIETTRRGITVDDRMMTSVDGVYAIGDVNGLCMLAHAASAQARIVLGEKVNLEIIPSAVFTTPEVAMVGKTEDTLRNDGVAYLTGKATFRSNGKALAMGENDGLVKILAEPETGRILGAHIVGPHASDLIQGVAYAIQAEIPTHILASTIHGHPTLSEVVQRALSSIK